MQNMDEFLYAKMRDKERFDINLKATYIIKGQGTQHQECQISNLTQAALQSSFRLLKVLRKELLL